MICLGIKDQFVQELKDQFFTASGCSRCRAKK